MQDIEGTVGSQCSSETMADNSDWALRTGISSAVPVGGMGTYFEGKVPVFNSPTPPIDTALVPVLTL